MKKESILPPHKFQKNDSYRLVTVSRPKTNIVTLRGSFLGGDNFAPKASPLSATFTALMFDEGTKELSKEAFHDTLDELGATLSFSCGQDRISFTASFLPKHSEKVIELIASALQRPAFRSKEFDVVKANFLAKLDEDENDTSAQAEIALLSALYPADHRHRLLSLKDERKFAEKVTLAEIKHYYRSTIGANDLIFVAAGNIPSSFSSEIEKRFGTWKPKNPTLQANESKQKETVAKEWFMTIKNKTTVDVYAGLRHDAKQGDEEFVPLVLGVDILGGAGFIPRLMANVRERLGLTYYIYAYVGRTSREVSGDMYIRTTFAPTVLKRGLAETKKVLTTLLKDGVTKEEVDTVKNRYLGTYTMALSSTKGVCGVLLKNLEMGLEPTYVDELLAKVQKVTKAEVNAALKKHIKANRLIVRGAGSVTNSGQPIS